MTATKDAVLMMDPLPCLRMCGSTYLQQKYTEVRLTFCTLSHTSMPVSRMESSSGGEIPALLKAMSTRPWSATTRSNMASTACSSVTSQVMAAPPVSLASASMASVLRSTPMTTAPSSANLLAEASPMPLAAPVITATLSCKRFTSVPLCGDEHVLGLGEGRQGVRPQFPAEAGLLDAAERRPVPHRGMRVDRQLAGLDPTGDPHGTTDVLGPDRPGQAVLGVVGQPDGLGLVREGLHGDDGPEHLLGDDPVGA